MYNPSGGCLPKTHGKNGTPGHTNQQLLPLSTNIPSRDNAALWRKSTKHRGTAKYFN
jgi:hypothetical protein